MDNKKKKDERSIANECWSMDFVSDQLYNGKRFRTLTALDTFCQESLAICSEKKSVKGEQVCEELKKIKAACELPERIKIDNGSISYRFC